MGFDAQDLAIFRICERQKWSLDYFDRLPEWERNEWLARDFYLMQRINRHMDNMIKVKDGENVVSDLSALMLLYLKAI